MKDKIFGALKAAGYDVFVHYQDPRRGGWRMKLEIGRKEKDRWAKMEGKHTEAVLAIVQKEHPDAKAVYHYHYRGLDRWVVAITYFKAKFDPAAQIRQEV